VRETSVRTVALLRAAWTTDGELPRLIGPRAEGELPTLAAATQGVKSKDGEENPPRLRRWLGRLDLSLVPAAPRAASGWFGSCASCSVEPSVDTDEVIIIGEVETGVDRDVSLVAAAVAKLEYTETRSRPCGADVGSATVGYSPKLRGFGETNPSRDGSAVLVARGRPAAAVCILVTVLRPPACVRRAPFLPLSFTV